MNCQETLKRQFTTHCKIIEQKGFNAKLILTIFITGLCFLLVGLLDKYITCIIGITLPTYWSIKAIETPETEDDKQWLTYWAVYACFTFLDLFAGFIMKFIPFYFVIKYVFLIWCFMPNTQGALFIYKYIIAKVFKRYEMKIDEKVKKVLKKGYEAADKTKEVIKENKGKVIEKGIELTGKMVEYVQREE